MNKSIRNILKKCGVPQHLIGYEYLAEAIELVYADRSYLRRINSNLYPTIAKKFNATNTKVERGIRKAIEKGLNNLPADEIKEIFGNTISYEKGKATNKQFIAALAELVEEE